MLKEMSYNLLLYESQIFSCTAWEEVIYEVCMSNYKFWLEGGGLFHQETFSKYLRFVGINEQGSVYYSSTLIAHWSSVLNDFHFFYLQIKLFLICLPHKTKEAFLIFAICHRDKNQTEMHSNIIWAHRLRCSHVPVAPSAGTRGKLQHGL